MVGMQFGRLKEGPACDLPIVLAILLASERISAALDGVCTVWLFSLDGSERQV